MEGEVLAEGLNLQREFFIDANSVASALRALDLSDINKTSRLLAHALNSIPSLLVEEVSLDTVPGLAHLILGQVNSSFINFTIEANNSEVSVHYFVINLVRNRARLYIQNNGHNQILELVGVFAFILSQIED